MKYDENRKKIIGAAILKDPPPPVTLSDTPIYRILTFKLLLVVKLLAVWSGIPI